MAGPIYGTSPLFDDCQYADQLYSDSPQIHPHYANSLEFVNGQVKSSQLPSSKSCISHPRRRRTRTRFTSGDSDCGRSSCSSEDALSTHLSRLSMSSESDDRQSSSDLSESITESTSSGYGSISQSPSIPRSHWDSTSEIPSENASSSSLNDGQLDEAAAKDTSSSTRKDSFVYDVRMTDDQFLFFVPDLDLVKSHLMFAVREEVDVLKERIVELMERVKQLECENSILRQYASPDVLQQLQQTPPSSNSHHSSS